MEICNFPKECTCLPEYSHNLTIVFAPKTSHKCIATTLLVLLIHSNSLYEYVNYVAISLPLAMQRYSYVCM